MNLLQKAHFALRFIGLGQSLQTLQYTRLRDRLNKKYPPLPDPLHAEPRPVGHVQRAELVPGGARFSFGGVVSLEVLLLAEGGARLTWQPGTLPVPYAIEREGDLLEKVRLVEKESGWLVAGERLEIKVGLDGGVRYFVDGHLLRSEQPPMLAAEGWVQSAELAAEAQVYGLGERAAQLNLRDGSRYRFWNEDPGGSYGRGSDPIYMTMPVYYCLSAAGGYLMFYENSHDGELACGDALTISFRAGALRCYFIPGEPAAALAGFTALTGRADLPPRWALGFHQSRWGYVSEADIREVAAGFAEHDLPLDVIHLDIDYMRGYRVFTVDEARYPDLAGLSGDMQAEGVRLVTIIDPGVKRDPAYDVYAGGLAQGMFCDGPDGKPLHGLVWPQWSAYPDFTDPKTRQWWGGHYPRLLDAGIAGIWHDMNEPVSFAATGETSLPRQTQHSMEDRGGSHEEAHNLYGMLMDRAGYEALRALRPERRPWLLTRSGWVGVQRYAWHWTGDVETSWDALRMTIATILGLGLSGVPYSGADIGGFSGMPDAELFTRWFQMMSLMPFFRNHAAVHTPRSEPWEFGEPTLSVCRDFLKLRHKLMPYLYTLAYEASQTGAPLNRPLFWTWPEERKLWGCDDVFMLGSDVLVAPVLQAGAEERQVQLPPGSWYDYWTDALHAGGAVVTASAPIDKIPLFVRAGCVLPQEIDGLLHLTLYPVEAAFESQHFADAGDGYGPSRLDRFSASLLPNGLRLRWAAAGKYPLPEQVGLRVAGQPAARFSFDGVAVEAVKGRIIGSSFEELEMKW